MTTRLEFNEEELDLIMCALDWAALNPPDITTDENLVMVQDWRRLERTIGDYLYRPDGT